MNTIHKNGNGNNTLDEELHRIGEVYQHLDPQEPPGLLDQAIVNSAHRAVRKKSGWMQFGWLHGVTTAAVIVLAISLILQQRQPEPAFEDAIDIRASEPSRLRQAAERPATRASSGSSRSEAEKGDVAASLQKMAAPASPVTAENEVEAAEELQPPAPAGEAAAEAEGSMYEAVREYRVDSDEKDTRSEQLAADELEVMLDTVPIAIDPENKQETSRAAKQARMQQDDEAIAAQLDRIIALKNAGDESWQAELQAFKQRYPDYPLPPQLEP